MLSQDNFPETVPLNLLAREYKIGKEFTSGRQDGSNAASYDLLTPNNPLISTHAMPMGVVPILPGWYWMHTISLLPSG